MHHLKDKLYRLCQELIDERIIACRLAIADAQKSANEETKSSSGDKYETGRAMAQLEIEKNSQQLSEALKLRKSLDQISLLHAHPSAQPGSMIVTDRGIFFIAIGLGKIDVEGKACFVIAPFSPLGLALAGCRKGEKVTFRDQTYVVQDLY